MLQELGRESGRLLLQLAFVDQDLRPMFSAKQYMSQGFVEPLTDIVIICQVTGHEYGVREGYLKDYFDDNFGNFLIKNNDIHAAV